MHSHNYLVIHCSLCNCYSCITGQLSVMEAGYTPLYHFKLESSASFFFSLTLFFTSLIFLLKNLPFNKRCEARINSDLPFPQPQPVIMHLALHLAHLKVSVFRGTEFTDTRAHMHAHTHEQNIPPGRCCSDNKRRRKPRSVSHRASLQLRRSNPGNKFQPTNQPTHPAPNTHKHTHPNPGSRRPRLIQKIQVEQTNESTAHTKNKQPPAT